jgi:pimeloyl-ACP methyl ester carboxylesterase
MASHPLPSSEKLAAACASDGEFAMAARYWNGGLRLLVDGHVTAVQIKDGKPIAGDPGAGPGVVTLSADPEIWGQMLAAVPPRFLNDISSARELGLEVDGDRITMAQYYGAMMRALELLRPPINVDVNAVHESGALPRFDSPTGRYVHLDLTGRECRVYFEEAGSGIPLLLQHTAGGHSAQWRHLFENPKITEHFRLIAYDLPFHGKSLPPVGEQWWAKPYRLEGEFLRSVPLALSAALELDNPAFMGCSVGGLLALDLALRHPDRFRAVISVEGALNAPGSTSALSEFWHPQVNSEYKARVMNGLMSPISPEPYRKETSQVYASGWPPVFLGDLNYYLNEFDLRNDAKRIDTKQVGVHILSGEYDSSATLEAGREAHAAIAGSTFAEMPGLGHFPMSEDPEKFFGYLLPILERIRNAK